MDRDELLNRLALLFDEGKLALEEAQELLRQYDAGMLNEADLPLTRAEERLIMLMALNLVNQSAYLAQARRRIRGTTGAVRIRLGLSDLFEEAMRPVSGILTNMDPDIRRWHDSMGRVIRDNAYSMAEAALGRRLFETEANRIRDSLSSQFGYLERFADEIAFRRLIGRPMSEAQIYDRSRQYAGFAVGLFYRLREEPFRRQRGYVAKYIPVDDGGTCRPCHDAGVEMYYLPGEGPMPGEVCVARGKCRCRRIIEFNIAVYERLT